MTKSNGDGKTPLFKYVIRGEIDLSKTRPLEAETHLVNLVTAARKLGDAKAQYTMPRLTNVDVEALPSMLPDTERNPE